MGIPSIVKADNILTFIKLSARAISLRVGDIVKAEVIEMMDSGVVSLRIIPVGATPEAGLREGSLRLRGDSLQESGKAGTILARSNIAMTKGEKILLKVIGGDREIKLRYICKSGDSAVPSDHKTESIPAKIFEMLSELSDSRLKSTDLKLMKDVFKLLPDRIKASFPEFKAIERLMPEIERLNAYLLKTSIESSGTLFETRLKFAVLELMQNNKGEMINRLLVSEPDQKVLLLKLKEMLKNEQVVETLKSSGLKYVDITDTVDRLIKNIEFFQLTSRMNDILYTFLPISWQELKDGELSFKRNINEWGKSYTCDITLDIEPLGKMSVSVTLFDGAFYISFHAEKPETKSLIISEKIILEEKFADTGLSLKTINVGLKQEISFKATKQCGFDLMV